MASSSESSFDGLPGTAVADRGHKHDFDLRCQNRLRLAHVIPGMLGVAVAVLSSSVATGVTLIVVDRPLNLSLASTLAQAFPGVAAVLTARRREAPSWDASRRHVPGTLCAVAAEQIRPQRTHPRLPSD